MTTPNWKALRPHVPVEPGEDLYIPRDGSAAEEIVEWIQAGRSPLLVGGPVGVGKSSELARAYEVLGERDHSFLLQIDRLENMRRLTSERLLHRLIQLIRLGAERESAYTLSDEHLALAQRVESLLAGKPVPVRVSTRVLVNSLLSEVLRDSPRGRVTILIDGLEKVPQGEGVFELFDALAAIREDVGLVVVIPWHAAFGPHAETVVRSGERFVGVRAVDVQGEDGTAAREFLRDVLLEHLGLPDQELMSELGKTRRRRGAAAARYDLVQTAMELSGGVPRVFLQLMADAGSYAAIRGRRGWPLPEDLDDAVADSADSFRRLLLPGDTAAVARVAGTSGAELDLDRKVRLLSHGVLLERMRNGRLELEVHPLLADTVPTGGNTYA